MPYCKVHQLLDHVFKIKTKEKKAIEKQGAR